MSEKNTGAKLEEEVYKLISHIVNKNEFIVSLPNVKIRKKPRYYSKDRDAEIEFDVSVEKYLANPDEDADIRPSIIVVIECKDYKDGIPVDDVEEFHAKLQQIGADNTKGIIITRNGCFQKSALAYAKSKGVALARMFPRLQVNYLTYSIPNIWQIIEKEIISILTKKDSVYFAPICFSSSTNDYGLEKLIYKLLKDDSRRKGLLSKIRFKEKIIRLTSHN